MLESPSNHLKTRIVA